MKNRITTECLQLWVRLSNWRDEQKKRVHWAKGEKNNGENCQTAGDVRLSVCRYAFVRNSVSWENFGFENSPAEDFDCTRSIVVSLFSVCVCSHIHFIQSFCTQRCLSLDRFFVFTNSITFYLETENSTITRNCIDEKNSNIFGLIRWKCYFAREMHVNSHDFELDGGTNRGFHDFPCSFFSQPNVYQLEIGNVFAAISFPTKHWCKMFSTFCSKNTCNLSMNGLNPVLRRTISISCHCCC